MSYTGFLGLGEDKETVLEVAKKVDLAYLRGIMDGLEAAGQGLGNLEGEITRSQVEDVIGAAYWEAAQAVRGHALFLYPLKAIWDATSKRAKEVSKPESSVKRKTRKRKESK